MYTFQMDKVPLTQVTGLVSIQQQLCRLSVHRGLHTLRELLIEAVEEKRGSLHGGSNSPPTRRSSSSASESWRISATAKLTTSRYVCVCACVCESVYVCVCGVGGESMF